MSLDSYNHFVCIVAGDNPEELMRKYDSNLTVEPYVVWSKKDADKIRKDLLSTYEETYKAGNIDEEEKEEIEETIKYLKTAPSDRIFDDFTIDYDKDPETGDAITAENPNGKWSTYQIGKVFSVPFINNEGEEVFSAEKKDVRWDLIHLHGKEIYERAWEMVVDGSKPENEYEEHIFENMKNRLEYFNKFKTKEMYVASCTAFWAYAFLSEDTGWLELEDDMDQFVWMTTFYDLFIKGLPDDTKLTIYECRK